MRNSVGLFKVLLVMASLISSIACTGHGQRPAAPATLVNHEQFATGYSNPGRNGGMLSAFRLHFSPDLGSCKVENLSTRSATHQGDLYSFDLGRLSEAFPFATAEQITETGLDIAINPSQLFEVTGIGLTPEHDLIVDWQHRHPFPIPESSTLTQNQDPLRNRADLGYTGRLVYLTHFDDASVDFFSSPPFPRGPDSEIPVRLNPSAILEPDGFMHLDGKMADNNKLFSTTISNDFSFNPNENNTFPYQLLANDGLDFFGQGPFTGNRLGFQGASTFILENPGGNPRGNYGDAAGWQFPNLAAAEHGNRFFNWTGYDFVHAGQKVNNTFTISADYLASHQYSLDVALFIKFSTPMRDPTIKQYFPPEATDITSWGYMLPHSALDASVARALPSSQISLPATANRFTLRMELRDWDARALEASAAPLRDQLDQVVPGSVQLVGFGASGPPIARVIVPRVLDTEFLSTPMELSVLPGHSGAPDDPLIYEGTFPLPGVVQPELLGVDIPGLVEFVDPEALSYTALASQYEVLGFDGNGGGTLGVHLTNDHADLPVTYQRFFLRFGGCESTSPGLDDPRRVIESTTFCTMGDPAVNGTNVGRFTCLARIPETMANKAGWFAIAYKDFRIAFPVTNPPDDCLESGLVLALVPPLSSDLDDPVFITVSPSERTSFTAIVANTSGVTVAWRNDSEGALYVRHLPATELGNPIPAMSAAVIVDNDNVIGHISMANHGTANRVALAYMATDYDLKVARSVDPPFLGATPFTTEFVDTPSQRGDFSSILEFPSATSRMTVSYFDADEFSLRVARSSASIELTHDWSNRGVVDTGGALGGAGRDTSLAVYQQRLAIGYRVGASGQSTYQWARATVADPTISDWQAGLMIDNTSGSGFEGTLLVVNPASNPATEELVAVYRRGNTMGGPQTLFLARAACSSLPSSEQDWATFQLFGVGSPANDNIGQFADAVMFDDPLFEGDSLAITSWDSEIGGSTQAASLIRTRGF